MEEGTPAPFLKHREILIHNVSHSDLVVCMQGLPKARESEAHVVPPAHAMPQQDDSRDFILARPKFNSFDYVATTLMQHLNAVENIPTIRPLVVRSKQGTELVIGWNLGGCDRVYDAVHAWRRHRTFAPLHEPV